MDNRHYICICISTSWTRCRSSSHSCFSCRISSAMYNTHFLAHQHWQMVLICTMTTDYSPAIEHKLHVTKCMSVWLKHSIYKMQSKNRMSYESYNHKCHYQR